jgi:hypothetical protein
MSSGDLYRIVSGPGILGYGLNDGSVAALTEGPPINLVACDAGSTDAGPYYLGSQEPLCSESAVEADFRQLFRIAIAHDAPLVVGTCGGSGTDDQVRGVARLAERVASDHGLERRIAKIFSEVSPSQVMAWHGLGRLTPSQYGQPMSVGHAHELARVVAMLGGEAISMALNRGADLVLAGRCSDAAIFAAPAMNAGIDPGTAWCAGKILECGASAADPPGPDALVAECREGEVVVYPASASRRCTVESVAGMILHENPDPFRHVESSGVLDLSCIHIESFGERAIRVLGAKFEFADSASVRLEGVRRVGHRTVIVASTRDPGLILEIDEFLERVNERFEHRAAQLGYIPSAYSMFFRTYGSRSPTSDSELVVVAEVIGRTVTDSRTLATAVRSILLHLHFDGRLCDEGNFALPFSPAELDGGEAFEFCLYHTMSLLDSDQIARVELNDVHSNDLHSNVQI